MIVFDITRLVEFRNDLSVCDETTRFNEEIAVMAWNTPTIIEICVGMEITSYESAEA